MRATLPTSRTLPLNMVGSNAYGRYPKISTEQTVNMFVTESGKEKFLVPFAGHELAININDLAQARGLFKSTRFNHMIAVIDDGLYIITDKLTARRIYELATSIGDVWIDENEKKEIALSDGLHIYIYNYDTGTINIASIDFPPGYLIYHDARFICSVKDKPEWRLCSIQNSTSWPADAQHSGSFQTKPDEVQAVLRFPGRGNMILVMGKTITEFWYDVPGAQLFPYQRNSSYNIDYGCVNPATIAANESMVAWVGMNEKSGPVILYSNGGQILQISDDGLNYELATLEKPQDSYGFFVKQDGHNFYIVTFTYDDKSFLYDFNTGRIYTLTDEKQHHYIAKKVVFFNNSYYFISLIDGNIYELNSKYTTYNGEIIPRIRISPPIRLPDTSPFITNSISFLLEQGCDRGVQRIDTSISVNGGESFGSNYPTTLNPLGKRRNQIILRNFGRANDLVFQFRFWGEGRFVVGDGVASTYQ